MKQELRKKIEELKWVNEVNENDKLMLSDDIDSLFSCLMLGTNFGCKVGSFYNFKELLYNDEQALKKETLIGVDVALCKLYGLEYPRCYDNHVTCQSMIFTSDVNDKALNVNAIEEICGLSDRYYDKFCGSTLIQIILYYDWWDFLLLDGHTELTDEQKLVLLLIDSTHLGKVKGYKSYDYWREQLGLEIFDDLYEKYTNEDFKAIIKKYKLDGKIVHVNGVLQTNINIEGLQQLFPMLNFTAVVGVKFKNLMPLGETKFETYYKSTDFLLGTFSQAVVYKDRIKYTKKPTECMIYKLEN